MKRVIRADVENPDENIAVVRLQVDVVIHPTEDAEAKDVFDTVANEVFDVLEGHLDDDQYRATDVQVTEDVTEEYEIYYPDQLYV